MKEKPKFNAAAVNSISSAVGSAATSVAKSFPYFKAPITPMTLTYEPKKILIG